jgi:pimeloyl-ACP methyl ester carboxylesterase
MLRTFLRRLLPFVLAFMGVALLVGAARAGAERVSIAGLDVTVWRPDGGPSTAAPIIVFSHGFHGCATQSRFLMTAFAAAGYMVVAPNHRDATCNGGGARWISPPERQFGQPGTWDEASFRDRADDIRHLVAALQADPTWRDRIDWQRLGLVGHSLGGYTVLGLAGAWPDWKLDGVKAVLALSPYVQPFLLRHSLAGLAAPVMYQGGTLDFGITPFLGKPMGAYDQSPSPKYYVELRRAGHLAWTDLGDVDHAAIVAYSVAFLDRYLRGATASGLLTEPTAAVATLRYATEPRP